VPFSPDNDLFPPDAHTQLPKLDSSPREDRAQSFGLWGIAGFIGSCLGPLVTGGVLWIFPGASMGHGAEFQQKNPWGCLGHFLGDDAIWGFPKMVVPPQHPFK